MEWIKPRVSYSQINAYYNYRKDFVNKYIYGIEPEPNEYMTFGKNFSEQIESYIKHNFYSNWDEVNLGSIIGKIMDLGFKLDAGHSEVRIDLALKEHIDIELDLIGYIDWLNTDDHLIIDFKTGKAWSIEDVKDSKQLLLYSAWYKQKYGIIPEVGIISMPVKKYVGVNGLNFTGDVIYHSYQPTEYDIQGALQWLKQGILDAMAYIKQNHSTDSIVQDAIIKDYIKAKAKVAEWKTKMELYRGQIEKTFAETGIDRYDAFQGHLFYSSKRYSYEYSDEVKDLENRLKEAKKIEEREGIAKVSKESIFWTHKEVK